MKQIAKIVSYLTLAAGFEVVQDEVASLLQMRTVHHAEASPRHFMGSSHEHFSGYNSSHRASGHPFGCTGKETAPEVIKCGLWGDVHQHLYYGGTRAEDTNGIGWFWLAKSKDGQFQAQAFYRRDDVLGPETSKWRVPRGWTTMSHLVFKFGDQILFLDRELQAEDGPSSFEDGRGESWQWKYYWNGQEISNEKAPLDVGPVHWVNRASGMANVGAETSAASFNNHESGLQQAGKRFNCFEYLPENVAVWVVYGAWQANSVGPYGNPISLEIEGARDFLQDDFGQCARNQQKVDPKDMLVTVAQNRKVCTDNQLELTQCEDPHEPPPPPPPSVEELCGCQQGKPCDRFEHAGELCASEKAHGQDLYDACVYDVCASYSADAEQLAAGGAALEAAMANPRPTCLIKSENEGFPCRPCNICSAATVVDLSNVVQNNLGGAGPDSGAEEIRYKNAINLDGKPIDVVLTAVTSYQSPKPHKNGHNQATPEPFGRFNMLTGTTSDLKFEFQDAQTFAPVIVPDLALTFYDLDQAKDHVDENQRQEETVSVCSAEEVYVTEDTELTPGTHGGCHSFSSSVWGNGADNPTTPGELTKAQAARSVTYEFHARSHIFWTATITSGWNNPRNVLFGFRPSVACGASDSETQCKDWVPPAPPPPAPPPPPLEMSVTSSTDPEAFQGVVQTVGLQDGVEVWTDRSYVSRNVVEEIKGGTMFKWWHKTMSTPRDLTFHTNRRVTLYLWTETGDATGGWPNLGWQAIGECLRVSRHWESSGSIQCWKREVAGDTIIPVSSRLKGGLIAVP